jgi:hypothetical protein
MQASNAPYLLVPPIPALPYCHRPVAGSQVPPISTAHRADMLVHLAASERAGTELTEETPITANAMTAIRNIAVLPCATIELCGRKKQYKVAAALNGPGDSRELA